MSRKWRNRCQYEVDEETKGADFRDKVKHKKRSDRLFLDRMLPSRLLSGTFACTVSSELLGFSFYFFIIFFLGRALD